MAGDTVGLVWRSRLSLFYVFSKSTIDCCDCQVPCNFVSFKSSERRGTRSASAMKGGFVMRADLICDADGVSIAGTPFKFHTLDALVEAFCESLKTPWQVRSECLVCRLFELLDTIIILGLFVSSNATSETGARFSVSITRNFVENVGHATHAHLAASVGCAAVALRARSNANRVSATERSKRSREDERLKMPIA